MPNKKKVSGRRELSDLCFIAPYSGLNGTVEQTPGLPRNYSVKEVEEVVKLIREKGFLLKFAAANLGAQMQTSFELPTSTGKQVWLCTQVYPAIKSVAGAFMATTECSGGIAKFSYIIPDVFDGTRKEPRYAGQVNVGYWVSEAMGNRKTDPALQRAANALIDNYLLRNMRMVNQWQSEEVNQQAYRKTTFVAPDMLATVKANVLPGKGTSWDRRYLDMAVEISSFTVPVEQYVEQMKTVIREACRRR